MEPLHHQHPSFPPPAPLSQVSGMGASTASAASSRASSAGGARDAPTETEATNLPSGPLRPQDVMLLARTSLGSQQQNLEVFDVVKTRVFDMVPDERGVDPELLVCFCYPSKEEGPANDALQRVSV